MIPPPHCEHQLDACRFQAELLGAVGQAIVAVDLDRVVIYWNRAAEEMYGWTADEAIGRRSIDLMPRIETAHEREGLVETLLQGRSWTGDYEITRRDGALRSVIVTNTPVFDEHGDLVAVIGCSVDATERIAMERRCSQLAAIVESSGDAIFSTTVDGVVTSWNEAAERLFGYGRDEIVGQTVTVLAPPGLEAEQAWIRDRLTSGRAHERLESVRVRKDGTVVDVLLAASAIRDEAGRVVALAVIAQDISHRVAAQRALLASRQRLAEAQRTARLGSFEFDLVTGHDVWSEEYCRILGLDPEARPQRSRFLDIVHPDNAANVADAWRATLRLGVPFDEEFRVRRTDGVYRWVRARAEPEWAADGSLATVRGTMMDDTERVESERERRAAETRFEIIFEQSQIGAVIVDLDGQPTRVNRAMCRILGRSATELIGCRWTAFVHPDDVPLGHMMWERVVEGHDTFADERRYVHPDGSTVWVSTNVTLVRDEGGAPQYYSAQFLDITARKEMEGELAHRVLHDTLTGLPNRALLADRLRQGLAGSRRRGARLGVMFLDIDQFKLVNDSLGHGAGDELLRTAAARITTSIRAGDTVARFGGDEFVVVCDDVSGAEIEQIAARVLAALSIPWRLADQDVHVTASIGIALADGDSTPESLLRDSDAAMYRAKRRGRGRIELFDDDLRITSERRLATATALHRAMDRDELAVAYQPVVDLATGRLVSVEALVRWDTIGRGAVQPAEFIPIAEETGLIVPIGAWVLEEACRQAVRWQAIRPGGPHLGVAVNLSIRQLISSDVAGRLRDVLAITGLDPADVCLELTESVFMEDVDFFGATLAGLKALGVTLAIDDFGTGYSSLSYLKRFPVDAVKIDRAFVDGLGTDPHDTALVAAILAMAGALDLDVIAEGVETVDQLVALRALGVRRAQGFHLARPMPADAIAELVATDHRWTVPGLTRGSLPVDRRPSAPVRRVAVARGR